MAISEESRHHLYLRLEEVLGTEEATTLMEHLPPVGWADVATKRDLDILAAATKRDIDDLRTDLKRDVADLKRDISELRSTVATSQDLAELGAATRHDLAEFGAHIERELRVLSWRFISLFVAALTIFVAVIKL
jgi:hypothetical protein